MSVLGQLRKSQYFPFQCSVLNKGTTGTIFITSLVWRGPWLGIEPVTSRTRSQHSTDRLSRRRWQDKWILICWSRSSHHIFSNYHNCVKLHRLDYLCISSIYSNSCNVLISEKILYWVNILLSIVYDNLSKSLLTHQTLFKIGSITVLITFYQTHGFIAIHLWGTFSLNIYFWCWWYLTKELIWHLSQSSIRPLIYFSSIVNSRSNPFVEPTSTKQ